MDAEKTQAECLSPSKDSHCYVSQEARQMNRKFCQSHVKCSNH